MKTKAQVNQKLMTDIGQKNKQLLEPLSVALKQVEDLKNALKDYEKDQTSLKHAQGRLKLLVARFKNLGGEHGKLENSFQTVQVRQRVCVDVCGYAEEGGGGERVCVCETVP